MVLKQNKFSALVDEVFFPFTQKITLQPPKSKLTPYPILSLVPLQLQKQTYKQTKLQPHLKSFFTCVQCWGLNSQPCMFQEHALSLSYSPALKS